MRFIIEAAKSVLSGARKAHSKVASTLELTFFELKEKITMKFKPQHWSQMNTTDFAHLDASKTVALLPLGATEQHGPHLPLCVDTCIANALVSGAVSLLGPEFPVVVLPTLEVGLSTEHTSFAGTLTHSPELMLGLLAETGKRVAQAGVGKLLFFNAHGGNSALMEIAARELRALHGLMVFSTSWFNLPLDAEVMAMFTPEEHRFGIHGGAVETSLMLDLHPEWVRFEQFKHFVSQQQERSKTNPILGNGRSAKLGWLIEDYNPEGAAGDLAQASAEKGRRLRETAAKQLSLLLEEISALSLSELKL
jgi:creatinine amidohydrolase